MATSWWWEREFVDAEQELACHGDRAELVWHRLVTVPQRGAEPAYRRAEFATRVSVLVGPHRPEISVASWLASNGAVKSPARPRASISQNRENVHTRCTVTSRTVRGAAGRPLLNAERGCVGEIMLQFRSGQAGRIGPPIR
jgi:hypothetical protein